MGNDRRANGELDDVRDEETNRRERGMTAKRGKGIKRSGLQWEREISKREK